MRYSLDLSEIRPKENLLLGPDFQQTSKLGSVLCWTNSGLMKEGKFFPGIAGEFHFSRMDPYYWDEELAKMKMAGINVVSTYVIWIHHEAVEGQTDFTGRRNLRAFVELCQKYGLWVILRIGPFAHAEARNGGLPDWLYGKPFECRSLNPGFFDAVRKWYRCIAEEVSDLFFQDDGPIIALQLDNEYEHSSAPWEMTTGISNEWVPAGHDGTAYMEKLKETALQCGLKPAFFTATAWGGAVVPDSFLPLWGGYAYRPWLFYQTSGEHPQTEEYVYQDYCRNGVRCTDDFQPSYLPESRPYACCEMGCGMMQSYHYRFEQPSESADALANVKLGSGCNFLGYYMFQGGSNPVYRNCCFLNESQVPKISYDYQAPLGEFGQVRESCLRLKLVHSFFHTFGEKLYSMQTVLPSGASEILPKDQKTLRYAVRTDGRSGFLFLNQFQDHLAMPDRGEDQVLLQFSEEKICFSGLSLKGGENCILPFHLNLSGIDLVSATAQAIDSFSVNSLDTYLFLEPDGVHSCFTFETGCRILEQEQGFLFSDTDCSYRIFDVKKKNIRIRILVFSRKLALRLYRSETGGFLLSEQPLFQKTDGLYLETQNSRTKIYCYPSDFLPGAVISDKLFGFFEVCIPGVAIPYHLEKIGAFRYALHLDGSQGQTLRDVLLRIRCTGDIGNAFINGRLIHDYFCSPPVWEIGLHVFLKELEDQPLVLILTPEKIKSEVKTDTTMAGRYETVEKEIGKLCQLELLPVYQMKLMDIRKQTP